MLKPPTFDASQKYPVIVHVYGEPAGQTVNDRWGGATRAVPSRARRSRLHRRVSFDNRGTPAPKGAAWRKVIYGTVGDLSSKEQAAAIARARRASIRSSIATASASGAGAAAARTRSMRCSAFPTSTKSASPSRPCPTSGSTTRSTRNATWALPEENADGYHAAHRSTSPTGCRGKLLIVHGIGRRQRALPGHRAAGQSADRARQAVRPDGLSEPHARISEGPGTTAHVYQADRALLLHESAARAPVASPGRPSLHPR